MRVIVYIKRERLFYKDNAALEELNKRLDAEKKKAEGIKEKLEKCKEYDEKIITAQNAIMDKLVICLRAEI